MKKLLLSALVLSLCSSAYAGGITNHTDINAALVSNPSLLAKKRSLESIEILLPHVSLDVSDTMDMYERVDDFQQLDQILKDSGSLSQVDIDKWESTLRGLDGASTQLNGNVKLALTIPTEMVSASLFFNTDLQGELVTHVSDKDLSLINNSVSIPERLDSSIDTKVGGAVELGLIMAKKFELNSDNTFYVGGTFKSQKQMSYKYQDSVSTFTDDINTDDYIEDDGVNYDLGLAYRYKDFTLGFSGINLVERELETNVTDYGSSIHLIEPQYLIETQIEKGGLVFSTQYQIEPIQYFSDSLFEYQYLSTGLSYSYGWVSLAAGYKHSLTDGPSDRITAGLSIHPHNMIGFTVGGEYSDDREYKASVNFVLRF
ncbi:conjugal transfer protein TraF [Photobacterium leiognathi]|uniref:conjugal transfer protein TraF n=1 Tax=Photobacterium leiognathi TaxID=553611 RepID=UPI0029822875|nr:conjugal transfer protein TraF [Photobacterium leiognathi]